MKQRAQTCQQITHLRWLKDWWSKFLQGLGIAKQMGSGFEGVRTRVQSDSVFWVKGPRFSDFSFELRKAYWGNSNLLTKSCCLEQILGKAPSVPTRKKKFMLIILYPYFVIKSVLRICPHWHHNCIHRHCKSLKEKCIWF